MQMITTIGLDIAKSVFQLHGVDAAGEVIIRRRLKRRYVLSSRSCRRAVGTAEHATSSGFLIVCAARRNVRVVLGAAIPSNHTRP
jgi:hypothetical protein